jgi:hypothetical protein
MLVATGLAVVIPQGNAFGDDVNSVWGLEHVQRTLVTVVVIVARILQVKWSIVPGLNWEKGSSLRMENLITL